MGTKDIATFINTLSFDKLPAAVVNKAKVAARDNLGVIVAAHNDKAVEVARRAALAMAGRGDSTLIGTGVKVPFNVASMVNAIMASTLDMDDGAVGPAGGLGHPGGMIVPTSLAVGEYRNSTGKELIEALVVGYEVAVRTSWMIKHSDKPIAAPLRRNAGISGTYGSQVRRSAGISGTYGSAASAAKLLGLSTKEIINALGIAEAHCPVSFPIDTSRGGPAMTKECMGWAAMTGVTAAYLAQEGFTGPITIYDLPEYTQEPWDTLGREWEVLNLYFKPYGMCRLGHASIDGVFELVKKYGLSAEDILEITIRLTSYAGRLSYYRPSTVWQAQYSIPFAIGAALVDGEVGPEQIAANRLGDKAILREADKVKLVIDPETDALRPTMHGNCVEITTKDGRKFETLVSYPRGDPRNPLSDEKLKGKFIKLATKAMGAERAKDLEKCLERLEELDSVNELILKISRLGD